MLRIVHVDVERLVRIFGNRFVNNADSFHAVPTTIGHDCVTPVANHIDHVDGADDN